MLLVMLIDRDEVDKFLSRYLVCYGNVDQNWGIICIACFKFSKFCGTQVLIS